MKRIAHLVSRWRYDPTAFVVECIKAEPTCQQKQALEALGRIVHDKLHGGEMAGKQGVSIRSGQICGKDCLAAWAILWFLTCFPRPKILCTAPSAHQLKDILWSEVYKWLKRQDSDGKMICSLESLFEIQSDKIFLKEREGKEWFAVARTISVGASEEEQAETLSGVNEIYKMVVIDEASGVAEPVFRPLQGGLGGRCNIALMIFNPTRRTGAAIRSQSDPGWVALHWDAEECPLVSKEHITAMAEKHGRDSNFFRIRIKGEPPQSEEGSLISWEWIEEAARRRPPPAGDETSPAEPVFFGVDCAGFGTNKSIILVRRGDAVEAIHKYHSVSTTDLAGWVLQKMAEHEPRGVGIDVIGLGAGVYDQVKLHARGRVVPVNVARASSKEKFHRLRDELWWRVREKFEAGTISIPDDEELMLELSSIKYEPGAKGQIKIQSKKDISTPGVDSPDRADALMISYWFSDAFARKQVKRHWDDDDKWDEYDEENKRKARKRMSWMVG